MVSEKDKVDLIKDKFKEINSAIGKLGDEELKELAKTKTFDDLLLAILDPKSSHEHKNLQEFFLKNKNKLSILAGIRNVITENYSFKGNANNKSGFLSPFPYQWLDNGVIFLQGEQKFTGLIGFYDANKDLYYAKSKRDLKPGENIDLAKDLFFDIFYQKINDDKSLSSEQKDKAIDKLEELKKEKDSEKRKPILEAIGKILGKAWYLSHKAFWDSFWENNK